MENEYYFITMEGSATDTVWFSTDGSSPTHSGNYWSRFGARSDIDACFYVYGESSTTPTIGVKYPLPAFKRS
jgi:meiotically up-regulated gene 157 (Mug157) protein